MVYPLRKESALQEEALGIFSLINFFVCFYCFLKMNLIVLVFLLVDTINMM